MKGTLKSKQEIERLFSNGRRSLSSYALIIYEEIPSNKVGNGKCAYIAGKKIGSAPQRNKCKRLLRSITNEIGAPWTNYNILFVARKKILTSNYMHIKKTINDKLIQIGVIVEEN